MCPSSSSFPTFVFLANIYADDFEKTENPKFWQKPSPKEIGLSVQTENRNGSDTIFFYESVLLEFT